jgi:hypothetical protein
MTATAQRDRPASGQTDWGTSCSPAGTRRHALGCAQVDAIETVFERMSKRVLNAIGIDRGPRIDVGPQIVPRNAIEALSHKHILSRKLPRLVQPTPYCGLGGADISSELGLPACLVHSGLEGFEAGGVRIHTANYSYLNKPVNQDFCVSFYSGMNNVRGQ